MKTLCKLAFAVLSVLTLTACDETTLAQTAKQTQSQKAADAANSITFDQNAEIDNIKNRLQLTSQPGLLGFIVVTNQMGQPLIYEGVKGKITSGNKRLTTPIQWLHVDCGQYTCDQQTQAPNDEGTFGSSDPYIYYWNTDGAYRQTNLPYFYSNQPVRLTQAPLIVTQTPQG